MNKMKSLFYVEKPLSLLIIMYLGLYFCACTDRKKEDFSDVPGVQNETWASIVNCNPQGELLIYTFDALNKWTAVSSNDWCELVTSSGNRGESKLKIVIEKNEDILRTATITIHVEGYKDVVISLEQEAYQIEVKYEVNSIIDDYLVDYYLWNDEYKKLSRDFSIPFVDFYENFLKTTLMGMTTNTLDKKKQIIDHDRYGNPVYDYTLYSYVDKIAGSRSSGSVDAALGVNHGVKKSGEIKSYGFSRLVTLNVVDDEGYPTGECKFIVQAVYPNSSASTFGVGRGTAIVQIDGKDITEANSTSLYLNLLYPNKSSVKLLVEFQDSISEVILTSTMLDPTPILHNKVFEVGENRVGYLMYDAFDAAYDNDLLEVVADFKSKCINDLILDLRYNGGGYVMSSNMLSSCLIGDECKDKIFHYYRYNANRMANIGDTQQETGHTYDKEVGLFGEKYMYDDYYGVNLDTYSLNLKRLFVLATNATASASEVLINSLRGRGISVILIGEKTNGKNVGMEVKSFNSEGYIYELAPITFQGYNERIETIPFDGLPVDYEISDWNNGYVDFGDLNEPMFKKAYELITGASRSVVVPSVLHKNMNGQIKPLPAAYKHPEGMIVRINN